MTTDYLTNFRDNRGVLDVSYHLNEAGALGKRRSNVAIIMNRLMLLQNKNFYLCDSTNNFLLWTCANDVVRKFKTS